MIPFFVKPNALRLPLGMITGGLLLLIFEKLAAFESDRMLVIGAAITMIGYVAMVGRIFSESTWLQARYNNSKGLLYLLLFTVFLFSFSQGIFTDFGSLFYFTIAAISILKAATMFPGFRNGGRTEETTS